MNILVIIQCSNLGGMERSLLEHARLLKYSGHDVHIYSLHPVGELKYLTDEMGIALTGSSGYKFAGVGNILGIIKNIYQVRPDRLWLVGHNFGALIAAKLSGIQTNLTIHYPHCERSTWFWRFFYILARWVCSDISFVSRYIYEEVSHLFYPDDHVVCIPNVFRAPEDKVTKIVAQEKLEIVQKAFVVGNAGWLVPRKAFDVFLQTAVIIKKRIPEAVFIIAGDGPERRNLEELAQNLCIADCVIFLGWQKNLNYFYRALDVLLFNSDFDALGRTPVEALCYGIPVVASIKIGGLGEVIRHGTDGFIINQHQPETLAEEVYKLYSNPEYRSRIVNTGRAHVLEIGSSTQGLKHLKKFFRFT